MKCITLTTDFGLRDGYVGVMRGVIWTIAPDAQVADISHQISPQNVLEGALVLGRTARFFPPGTVHVAVVDPGVGTSRRPIAARLGNYFFVLPDNGLVTAVLEQAEERREQVEFVHLDQPRFWRSEVSRVFHGRDIFSPVAAHLANGVPLAELGTPINDPQRLSLPRPERIASGWRGHVVAIDHFGNLSTDVTRAHLASMGNVQVHVAGQTIRGLVRTFGERPAGELIALYGTHDDLIISVVNGSAAERLNASLGDTIDVFPMETGAP